MNLVLLYLMVSALIELHLLIKIQNRVWEVTNAYGKIRLDMSSKDWSYALVKIIHKILFKSTCKYSPQTNFTIKKRSIHALKQLK